MAPGSTLHFGPLSLDGMGDGLWCGPERRHLTAKAEAVLRYLFAHPGRRCAKPTSWRPSGRTRMSATGGSPPVFGKFAMCLETWPGRHATLRPCIGRGIGSSPR